MNRSTFFDQGAPIHAGPSKTTRPIRVTEEDVQALMVALEEYKQSSGRLFPTWSEVLEVICALGYAKRIWKPVESWSPLASGVSGGNPLSDDPPAILGWFASVETPLLG